jgi:hypothetical protein
VNDIRRRIVITLLLAIALGGFFYAFTRPTDRQQPALRDAAVRHVEPAPGDLVLRQTEIAVDLDPTYTGILTIDGHHIPEDQLDRIRGLNRVSFTPGEGKDFTKLSPGRHCAGVELWPTATPDVPHRSYPWCFEVH